VLGDILRKFFGGILRLDGKEYSKQGYSGIQNALNRWMTGAPFNRNIDVVKDVEFTQSRQVKHKSNG
jgi:hypothetical protein